MACPLEGLVRRSFIVKQMLKLSNYSPQSILNAATSLSAQNSLPCVFWQGVYSIFWHQQQILSLRDKLLRRRQISAIMLKTILGTMPKSSLGSPSTKARSASKAQQVPQADDLHTSTDIHAACYKHTFLKDVILRVDFGSRVEILGKNLPQKIASAALKRFPISEPQKGHLQSITFSPTTLETSTQETAEWIYHGRDRKKTLILTPDSLSITNTQYESFESLCDDYRLVLKGTSKNAKWT